ncbi:MAG: sulfur carrier protein ThiS [Phycisphaeraceae bacterium]
MEVTINGETRKTPSATVRELIEELGLGDQPVAVERNREVVPKRQHGEVELQDGDVLELVTLVGGG